MCKISNELSRIKVGFKVVAVKDGKIYSIFTGQEYKVGKVPPPPETQFPLVTSFRTSLDFQKAPYYHSNFAGNTAVFYNKKTAEKYRNNRNAHHLHYYDEESVNYKIKIAKISFTGKVYKGEVAFGILGTTVRKIIAGSEIKSIEIVD